MKALNQYYNTAATASTDVAFTSVYSEFAAVQPYIGIQGGGANVTGRIRIIDAGVTLLDVSLTANYVAPIGGVNQPPTGTVTWAVGESLSSDVPTNSGRGVNEPPLTQGARGIYYAANYNLTYVPPTAILRVEGTTTNASWPPILGVGLSTKPLAAFTQSGGSTGTVATDGTTSKDSVVPASSAFIDDTDNLITAYIWTWGDSTTDTTTGPTASHVYAASGTYTVGLEVRDKYMGRARTSTIVAVTVPQTARLISGVAYPSGVSLIAEMVGSGSTRTLTINRYDTLGTTTQTTLAAYKAPTLLERTREPKYLMAQESASSTWKLLTSLDFGKTWSVMSSPWDSSTKDAVACGAPGGALATARIHSTTFAVEVKISRDGGTTWDAATSPGNATSTGTSLSLWAAHNGTLRLYLICQGVLSKLSDDMARTWQTL